MSITVTCVCINNYKIAFWKYGRWLVETSGKSCLYYSIDGFHSLSYTIPWRSGSYTCFSNRSVAKNMADFDVNWRHYHDYRFRRLMVIITDQAQSWSRLNFHIPLVFLQIFFGFCRFCSKFLLLLIFFI